MEQTPNTSSTSISSDPTPAGSPSLATDSNFIKEWEAAVPVGKDSVFYGLISRAMELLCPGISFWEARFARPDHPPWDTLDGWTEVQYGSTAYFLFNPRCVLGTEEPLRYMAATVLHEVLHLQFYPLEQAIETAFDDDDNLGAVLDGITHQLIDRQSWVLLSLVYPWIHNGGQKDEEVCDPDCSCLVCHDGDDGSGAGTDDAFSGIG